MRPITVPRVGGHDYLLAANTPDNSIEIYDTSAGVLHPRSRPTSPAVRAPHRRRQGVSQEDPQPVPATRETLIVTHMMPDLYGWYDAVNLTPVQAGFDALHAEVPIDLDADGIDDTAVALKEPRTLSVHDDELIIIATKGGKGAYDNDIYCRNLKTDAVRQHGLLGTTHFNQRIGREGLLFVAGAMARNDLKDEPNVAVRAVGFNETLAAPKDLVLYREAGNLEKVFVTAMSSDRVGVLDVDLSTTIDQWSLGRIPISPVAGNPMISNTDFYVHIVQVLQHALLQEAASEGAFGLTGLRHEAPRRAEVLGFHIQPGAVLEIFAPNDPSGVRPDITTR